MIAGVIDLSRYVASLTAWEVSEDEDWHQCFLGALADSINEIRMAQLPAR
ncbi:hypothetical protein [Bradyrhizobium sp. STM 3561]